MAEKKKPSAPKPAAPAASAPPLTPEQEKAELLKLSARLPALFDMTTAAIIKDGANSVTCTTLMELRDSLYGTIDDVDKFKDPDLAAKVYENLNKADDARVGQALKVCFPPKPAKPAASQ